MSLSAPPPMDRVDSAQPGASKITLGDRTLTVFMAEAPAFDILAPRASTTTGR